MTVVLAAPCAAVLLARAASLVLALVLDLFFGDPPSAWHPVAWLGRGIAALERALRRVPTFDGFWGGALLAVITVTLATSGALAVSWAAHRAGLALGIIADAVLIWLTLAARSLAEEGRAVSEYLCTGDLAAARTRLARIVARRTDVLDESGVAKATIESMGENVVDGVIAPVFWAALLGPAGAWLHKAASTLDSMVGYRDERYERFGTASARLDDVLAWVPARLALAVVPLAAAITGRDARGAWRVGLVDRLRHASPNSAHGEATFAGALGVTLGGRVAYSDRVTERPIIGEGGYEPVAADAFSAAGFVVATTIVTVVLAVLVMVGLALCFGVMV